MKIWSIVLVFFLALASMNAEAAKRLGGGKSVGKQSSNVTQREAAAPSAGAATQSAAKPATPAPAATPAAPAPAPKRPWGAMLGGLAAGLGLAWLASSLGLGAAMGQFMLFALLALVIMVVVGMILRARKPAVANGSPFAFQGAGATPQSPEEPKQYSADKVGNDASARPWERNSMAFDASRTQADSGRAQGGLQIGSALEGSQNWGVPAGFDTAGFLDAAKRNFVTLQDAWDRNDIPSLRAMMTDEMLVEIKSQLAEREAHSGTPVNKTDVVMIEAQLLGIEDLGEAYMASVEFSGMIREEPSAGPSPFREVWNMTKPKNGASGWLVAGVQALQ